MKRPVRALLPVAALASAVTLTLPACSAGTSTDSTASGGSLKVLASFYPLQYVAEQVGGDRVDVTSLTPPGAEPHDLELSPAQVRSIGKADLVVYLSGFQAAVDDAVNARHPEHVVDAATTPAISEAQSKTTGEEGMAHDPHIWLDPSLLASVAPAVADELAAADPAGSDDYKARATTLVNRLNSLDASFRQDVARCEQSTFVTAHAAFGYLATRYGLTQVPISGLDPEVEPSPARLREIRDAVAEAGVTTIFTEDLISPKVAETLASDLGIKTAVLDPIESQVDPKTDYRGAMEQNLKNLRAALDCP
jgi:zinc transport system substrate-binding protein